MPAPGKRPGMDLTVEALMAAASRKVNLYDWGDNDFHEPLEKLLESFKSDDAPGGTRSLFFRDTVVNYLCVRLLVRNDFRRYPQIADTPLPRPLIVTGLARSGTTLLHNLISQDKGARSLAFWELIKPSPPPDAATRVTDPRITAAENNIKQLNAKMPHLEAIHKRTATGPEECKFLKFFTFMTEYFYPIWNVISYVEWFFEQDMTPSYHYYRRLLQLLTWRCPGEHLALKCPSHLPFMDVLWKVIPEANIVWIHRDPLKALPSSLSFGGNFVQPGRANRSKFIELTTRYGVEAVRRADAARKRIPAGKVVDVAYGRLVKEPKTVVKEIYDAFGYDFNADAAGAVDAFIAANPKGKHGAHSYLLADFDLTEKGVKETFAHYYDAYGQFLV